MVLQSNSEVPDYEPVVNRMKTMFESIREENLDDPQTIVDEIFAAATGSNRQFRILVGKEALCLVLIDF